MQDIGNEDIALIVAHSIYPYLFTCIKSQFQHFNSNALGIRIEDVALNRSICSSSIFPTQAFQFQLHFNSDVMVVCV